MARPGKIISSLLCVAILLVFTQNIMSQSDSLLSVPSDTSSVIKSESNHSFYAGGGYGSNLIYLGSTMSGDQPYGYAALSYGYKSSLYLTISAIHLEKRDPYAAFFTGTMNYSHTFNSWFDISLNASRYQVAPSLTETLFGNFFYSDATLGIDWRILYTKLSAGWLYSGESNMYYQIRNSRFFTTPSFFRKKAYITFDPYINILFGSLSTVVSNTDTIITVKYPFRHPGKGAGNGSGSSTGSTSTTQVVTTSDLSSKFGLMEIDMGIPVTFNINRFTLEAEPGYILPMFDDLSFTGTKGFVFTLSCYIKIF